MESPALVCFSNTNRWAHPATVHSNPRPSLIANPEGRYSSKCIQESVKVVGKTRCVCVWGGEFGGLHRAPYRSSRGGAALQFCFPVGSQGSRSAPSLARHLVHTRPAEHGQSSWSKSSISSSAHTKSNSISCTIIHFHTIIQCQTQVYMPFFLNQK